MSNSKNWKFVTPTFVTTQKTFKTFKTSAQVKTFAVKNDVLCGWFKNTTGKGKHFLVEFSSFKKAATTTPKSTTKTASAKKTTKTAKTAKKSNGTRTYNTKKTSKSNKSNSWTRFSAYGNSSKRRAA